MDERMVKKSASSFLFHSSDTSRLETKDPCVRPWPLMGRRCGRVRWTVDAFENAHKAAQVLVARLRPPVSKTPNQCPESEGSPRERLLMLALGPGSGRCHAQEADAQAAAAVAKAWGTSTSRTRTLLVSIQARSAARLWAGVARASLMACSARSRRGTKGQWPLDSTRLTTWSHHATGAAGGAQKTFRRHSKVCSSLSTMTGIQMRAATMRNHS